MLISIRDLARGERALAGSAMGRQVLLRLLATIEEPPAPAALLMDFRGVNVATASFLRDGPLAFRLALRERRSHIYPTIANAAPVVVEELRLFADATNDAMFICDAGRDQRPTNVRLIGRLDEKQLLTLDAVRKLKDADTTALVFGGFEPGVKATAWNNRLTALVQKGLVMELSRGRPKRFRLAV